MPDHGVPPVVSQAATASLYRFSDYLPEWPLAFAREAQRLESLLGDGLQIVHHIGSTSVPGLAAKAVVDLLPVVWDITRIDRCTPALVRAGYRAWGEYGLPGRRFFTRDLAGYRTHNIHIYPVGHPDVDRHLAFCAYLRNNEKLRQEYEILKRQAYASHPSDIGAYNGGAPAVPRAGCAGVAGVAGVGCGEPIRTASMASRPARSRARNPAADAFADIG